MDTGSERLTRVAAMLSTTMTSEFRAMEAVAVAATVVANWTVVVTWGQCYDDNFWRFILQNVTSDLGANYSTLEIFTAGKIGRTQS
jgi:hypothetical protein